MSPRLKAPVLTVDAAEMRKVDPRNTETLFGMWTVFSKCAEAMEEGRRYENLSWRLWNRETFCCNSQAPTPAAPSSPVSRPRPRRRPSANLDRSSSTSSSSSSPRPSLSRSPSRLTRSATDELPELSASVESAVSDRGDDATTPDYNELRSTPLDIGGPAIRRLDSFGGRSRSRGQERHLTPIHLERMFSSIKARKELEPLELSPASRDVIARPCTAEFSRPAMTTLDAKSPPLTLAPPRESRRPSPEKDTNGSQQATVQPVPCATETAKKNMFLLGGSSGEDESSLDDHMRPSRPHRSALADGPKPATTERKQTSFKDEVVTRTIRENLHEDSEAVTEDDAAIEDDDDEDDDDDDVLSESAIEDDDDDDSEWDSITESGRSSVEEKPLFQRVDSKPNLTSRRSLLTNLLHQSQRADAFAQVAARSTPAPLRRSRTAVPVVAPEEEAEADDEAAVEEDDHETPPMSRIRNDVPRSRPIIMTASTAHPPALSPRTTRLNMLATELTESLRRHLLWERQQKNTTATAVLKRRHTAHDVARLQEFPQETTSREASKNNSWNHYYFDLGLGEYHQKGW